MYIVFVRLYFGSGEFSENCPLLNAEQIEIVVQVNMDFVQMETENTMGKLLRVFLCILLWQSEVVWLLKSLCHGC